jgi:hypothetical protein
MRKVLLATVVGVLLCATSAFALPFDSSGWVNPNLNNSWSQATASGTAQYTFYIDNPAVSVTGLSLQFEGDIFDLSQLDVSDFTMVAPAGWITTMYVENSTLYWSMSGGAAVTSVNNPITLDVDYVLQDANRMYFGNSEQAGDAQAWGWNEAQGANTAWSQKYVLTGPGSDPLFDPLNYSPGSTGSAVPEPASMMLLGMGLAGLVSLRKKA